MTIVATALKDRLPTTIRTARLVLTTPVMAHAPAIAALANNANVHKWMARLPFPYSLSDAEFFINEIVPSAEEFCLSIICNDDYVGVVGLHLHPEKLPELGYWLGEPHWGHGYATEASQALVVAARAAGATALRSRARQDNAASRKVLAKLGFTEMGEEIEADGNLAGQTMVLMHQDLTR